MYGRSFINCVHMKGNLIHTTPRAFRGRPDASTRCDACTATESLGHILQVCRRTHDSRVERHDGVNALLRNRGFATAIESAIPTPAGMRYPDIVANKPDICVVIDTTIVADNFCWTPLTRGRPHTTTSRPSATGAVRQPTYLPMRSGSARASSTGAGRLRRESSTNFSP